MATSVYRPKAAGSQTNIYGQYPDSTYHWDKVDEGTPDDEATRVHEYRSSYYRDLYNPEIPSESGRIVDFVRIYFRCRETTGGNGHAKASLKSDSTVTDSGEATLTTSFANYYAEWDTNPANGHPWEWSDLTALEIGVALSCDEEHYSYCTQVYVQIDWHEDANILPPLANVTITGLAPTITAEINVTISLPIIGIEVTGLAPSFYSRRAKTIHCPRLLGIKCKCYRLSCLDRAKYGCK